MRINDELAWNTCKKSIAQPLHTTYESGDLLLQVGRGKHAALEPVFLDGTRRVPFTVVALRGSMVRMVTGSERWGRELVGGEWSQRICPGLQLWRYSAETAEWAGQSPGQTADADSPAELPMGVMFGLVVVVDEMGWSNVQDLVRKCAPSAQVLESVGATRRARQERTAALSEEALQVRRNREARHEHLKTPPPSVVRRASCVRACVRACVVRTP